jgi:NADH-quinone oxidoreductase subunit G
MTDVSQSAPAVAITVNGAPVDAKPGELVIDACERNGVYIPRFCYHPRMAPVGMCRMCLVNIDTGRGPALQPSCMIRVAPNMAVDTEAPNVKKAQDGVLEFLLINHPLDCPVCDKGGECPLQDQTMAYGPGESRFVEEKRHFEKPIPISDLVYLDRERCILCDRCTRFAKEVAGDPLIHFMERGSNTEVNTFPDDPFSSYFSGNTVQICPVGALTARPYRFKARPWDLEESESTATVDSVGSRITVQSSRNVVLRYLGVDNDAVNWGWLSDKERFSFEALNSERRLSEPLMRGDDLGNVQSEGAQLVRATWGQALRAAAEAINAAGPERLAVLGGARLTNEAAYAWAKLTKGLIGTDNVDCQLGDGLPAELLFSLPRATIDDACAKNGVVVLLGPDPKEELGALYLRLRHAIVNDGVTLIELTPRSTGLSPYAKHRLHARPGEVDALVRALVAGEAPALSVAGVDSGAIDAARVALAAAATVTVIVGRPSLAESADVIAAAAVELRQGLPVARFLSALRRGNVHGALDMGLAPGLLPGRVALANAAADLRDEWPGVPSQRGLDARGILEAAAEGRITTLVLLGADPLCDFPDTDLARRALERVDRLIAVDLFVNTSVAHADVVLAAAGPTEVDGTFTNLEGRISPLAQQVTPPGTARADWIIAADLAAQLGKSLRIESHEQIWAELVRLSPAHAGLDRTDVTDGVVVGASTTSYSPAPLRANGGDPAGAADNRDASDTHGSLLLVATRTMYDQGVSLQHSPSSAHLASPTSVRLNPADFDALAVADGTTVRVSTARGSVEAPATADKGVPRGSAAMVFNQANASAAALIDASARVTTVQVGRL